MATLVKTSKGGFNVETITNWITDYNGYLVIWLACGDREIQSHILLEGHEADRAKGILETIALFDATKAK